MVTFAELRDARPALWSKAADDILSAAKQCERVKDDIHDIGTMPLGDYWTGDAYGMASEVLTEVAGRADMASILARSAVDPLDTLNHAIQIAQTELDSGVKMASAAGLVVDQDHGTVSLPPGVPVREVAAKIKVRNEAQKLIKNALDAATRADDLCARALTAAAAVDITKINYSDFNQFKTLLGAVQQIQADDAKKALQELADTIPQGLSADEVTGWWNGLTAQEQFDLERACPTQLYGMAGIPKSVQTAIDRKSLGYSSVGTVHYAYQNWRNSSLDWSGKDNCTNFVSDALAYGGGMKFKEDWGGLIPRHFDSKGWSDGTNGDGKNVMPPGWTHTPSWGAAQNNRDFFLNNGGTVVSPSEARPGDVMYYSNAQAAGGATHHAVVVTAVLPDNQVLYTQHSGGALNYPLYGRLPQFSQEDGPQTIQIVQPKVTW